MTQDSEQPSARSGSVQPDCSPVPLDDYPAEWWDEDGDDTCSCCGGDGVVEYLDHPEVWGEDCPSEMNHLVPCPECAERERMGRRRREANAGTERQEERRQ